jgi:ferric-dicitrate binding protein FerR (iron transport regulator)
MESELEQLLDQFRNGSLSPDDRARFHELLRNPQLLPQLEALIDRQLLRPDVELHADAETRELVFQAILLAKDEESDDRNESATVPFKQSLWKRMAIAASVTLVVAIAAYFIFSRTGPEVHLVQAESHDVMAPRVNRALLTLANGATIPIDSVQKGMLAVEGDIKVIKTSAGEIQYSGAAASPAAMPVYNLLQNPRGSRVLPVTLNDGTRVWLNSESSLRYPVAFWGGERRVEITGEAYFEVAHDASQPFIVSTDKRGEVRVLGTHFNVNSYHDEPSLRVTLLEGSVYFKANGSPGSAMLKPGEQAVLKDNQVQVVKNTDLLAATAWKDNRFYFIGNDIETIRRQLSRWYDVDISLEANIPEHFTAVISRDVNASEVFNMLQKTGTMKVKIEGKKITISR